MRGDRERERSRNLTDFGAAINILLEILGLIAEKKVLSHLVVHSCAPGWCSSSDLYLRLVGHGRGDLETSSVLAFYRCVLVSVSDTDRRVGHLGRVNVCGHGLTRGLMHGVGSRLNPTWLRCRLDEHASRVALSLWKSPGLDWVAPYGLGVVFWGVDGVAFLGIEKLSLFQREQGKRERND